MSASKIEWTDRTWNPTTGCTKVSPGCDHCYAEGIAHRFAGTPAFPNGFNVSLRPSQVAAPLRWKKPARVFVNSMSDLFHDDVPDEFIARVWATMAATPQHTYQVLTKRHGRMRAFLSDPDLRQWVEDLVGEMLDGTDSNVRWSWRGRTLARTGSPARKLPESAVVCRKKVGPRAQRQLHAGQGGPSPPTATPRKDGQCSHPTALPRRHVSRLARRQPHRSSICPRCA